MSLVTNQDDSIAQIQATSTSSIPESQGKPPTPQFLLKLNQGHLIALLRFFLRWLAEDDVKEQEVSKKPRQVVQYTASREKEGKKTLILDFLIFSLSLHVAHTSSRESGCMHCF